MDDDVLTQIAAAIGVPEHKGLVCEWSLAAASAVLAVMRLNEDSAPRRQGAMVKLRCPKCGAGLQLKALADSDQRIWAKWGYCSACGWDERRDGM